MIAPEIHGDEDPSLDLLLQIAGVDLEKGQR